MSTEASPLSRSFGGRAVTGAVWLSLVTVANGLIGATVSIFLARRLGPGPIGVYALAIAASDLAALAVTWGIDTFLVQAREDSRPQFGTALTLALLLSGAFFLISVALAAVLVLVLHRQPLLALLVLGLAVQRTFLLTGTCYGALLQRRFQFGWLAVIQIVMGVVEHLAAVAVALAGGGALALLARDVLDPLGLLVGARLVSRRPYRLAWDRGAARAMRRFGLAIFAGQTGDLSVHKLDSAILGATWGTGELAFYEESFKLADVARRAAQPALSQVALTTYARLAGEPRRRSAIFQVIQALGVRLLLPFLLALLLLPRPLILLLFGSQWLGAVPIVRAFAGYAVLVPLFEHVRQLLLSQGAAAAVARARIVQLLVFLACLGLLLPRWGGEGAALAVGAGVGSALLVAGLAARRFSDGVSVLRKTYLSPLVASGAAALAVLWPAAQQPAPVRLAGMCLVYAAVLVAMDRKPLRAAWARKRAGKPLLL